MFKYIYSFIIIIILSGCFEERIELDLNDGSERLVIVGWISDLDEQQYVTLTKTVNYLGEDDPVYVSDATVVLKDEVESYTLTYDDLGRYNLPIDFEARVGDLYHLEVEYDGVEYTAEQLMRPCPEIEQLVVDLYTGESDATDSLDRFRPVFAIQEMPGEGDAYFAIDYLKGSPFNKFFTEGGFTDDEFIDGEYLEDIRVGDKLYEVGDTLVVDLYSIGKETSDFMFDIEAEIFRDGPFDPPPANIRTNITGGALGYFIVSGASREVRVVK